MDTTKFNLHEYWNDIPLREANYTEFFVSFKPLLKELENIEMTKKNITDIDLFLHLKNNPLLLQKGNEKESRVFLANFSKIAATEIYDTLLGFLFLCKYDFEGFMFAYETFFLKFPSKDLSLNNNGDYLIDPSGVLKNIKKIYRVFFEGCIESELKRLSKIDPAKFEERKAAISNYNYQRIQDLVQSFLVQEGRSKNDGIEFEYFCANIFPKIKASAL